MVNSGVYSGAHGEVWGSQEDMLLDGIGATAGLGIPARTHDRQLEQGKMIAER